MPISLNARTATYYQPVYKTEREQEYSTKANSKNLMQFRENKEYNGELSARAKTKIKNYGANMILINSANIVQAHTPPERTSESIKTNDEGAASPAQNVVGKAKETTTTKNRAALLKQGNNSTKP